MLKHAVDSVEQLAHDGSQGDQLGFAVLQQAMGKAGGPRFAVHGYQRGHVQGGTQVTGPRPGIVASQCWPSTAAFSSYCTKRAGGRMA